MNAGSELSLFAEQVGSSGPVTVAGLGTRGGPVDGVRRVTAPTGVRWVQADEMTVCCGAAAPVAELSAALAEVGQFVALPPGGTVGGALAVGHSGLERLGHGPVRDTLLQAHYVSAEGLVVKAGGPTVKNVSGFDLCRLLVGSRGTIGFLGEVILRTRPLPAHRQWFTAAADEPFTLFAAIDRPTSVLWNGQRLWVLLEGNADDVHDAAQRHRLEDAEGPPPVPAGRHLVRPAQLNALRGEFVAEVGVGVVHGECTLTADGPVAAVGDVAALDQLNARIKAGFDPDGRLNPGRRV